MYLFHDCIDAFRFYNDMGSELESFQELALVVLPLSMHYGIATLLYLVLYQEVVGSYFSMTTTTSPNSLLLASLDATRAQFQDSKVEPGGEEYISDGRRMIREAVHAANAIRELVRSRYHTPTGSWK